MVLSKTIVLKLIILIQFFLYAQNVLAQPSAEFSATPVTGCVPLLVTFTDLSTGNPTSWKWDLGNGTLSSLQNPSATYFTSGQYTITLIATNLSGSDTIIKDQYITVQSNPIADFASNQVTGCLPLAVQFIDNSTSGDDTVISWKWDFGDGLFDSTENPGHTYTSPGTFDVTVQVKNNFGCTGSISKLKYINTSNAVVADFRNNVPATCKPPVNLNFQNLSSGPSPLTYQWDFGDGFTSMLINPSHTYSTAGNFTVKLIASSGAAGGCSDTIQKVITTGAVKADFVAPITVCQGKPFSIINASSPLPLSVSWNFGDGTASGSLNPVKTFNNFGNYNIKMVADFGACLDSVSKPVTVLTKQNISFTADDTATCKAPFTVNFTSDAPGATSVTWNFGDGSTSTDANPIHTYNSPGTFDVSLIAMNSSGCQDTLTKPGYVKVEAAQITLPGLPAKGCVPFTYTFSPSISSGDPVVKYAWDFGDGTTDTTANPSHTFTTVGSYTIILIITTINGCIATAQVVNGVNAGTKPVANFMASPLVACVGTPISFTDLSTGNVNEWHWSFGDKVGSGLKNPEHSYQDTGYFTVKLVARSNGCPDSISFSKYIYINPPVAKFSIKGNCALLYEKVFLETSKGADTFLWNFGDGTTSTSKTPTHVYADTGVYPVTLTVTNLSTGCQDTLTRDAQVINEKANFIADNTNICKNSIATFRSQNINLSNISTYDWNFGDGSSAITSIDTVDHVYATSGNFSVRLIITSIRGCNDTLVKPLYIKVDGPIAKFTSNQQTSCFNNSVNFIDSSLTDGIHPIVTWTWDYGDSALETLTSPPFMHTYTTAGTHTIKLKVTDSNGCMDSLVRSDYLFISRPVADFTSQDTASCPLAPVKFNNLSQGTNLTWLWNFGDGAIADSANPIHQYTYVDTFTVSLKITDMYGCTDSLQKTNYIGVSYPKANFTLGDSVSACPPFSVTFINSSINYTSLLWDFGDGNSSTSINPTHVYYIPGTYIVKLRAMNSGCFDEKFVTVLVKGPKGVFTYTNLSGCDSLTTNFKASATDDVSFTWDFNDGTVIKTTDSSISHTYLDTGHYLPKLILEDLNGCKVPISGLDTIRLLRVQANFNSPFKMFCDAGVIPFSDSSLSNGVITNWLWNFGDASTSSQQNPTHYYSSSGVYAVSLIATTANGCKDTVTKVAYAKIIARPDITIQSNTTACKSDSLVFNGVFIQPDTSTVSWQWDFANGQTSTLQNPRSQIYTTAGNYTVSAIAANSSGCKDTATQTLVINPLPNINAGNDAFLCLGSTLQLQASGALTYQWIPPTDFLSCSNCSNPVTSTSDDITYLVKGTDGIGCSAVDSVTIQVKKPFTITINPDADSVCIGDGVQLNASNAENYLWTPANSLNNAFIRNPVASPQTNTIYKVLAYDSGNCFKDSAYVSLSVFDYPTVDAGPDKTIKSGITALILPVYSNDIIKWMWAPPTGLNCNDCPAPIAQPNITTTYTIKVQNNGGCSATDNVTIFTTCTSENIFIPNTFSPNGDGVNDIFYPRGTGLNRIKGMKIFDRWGNIIFERSNFYANDPASGWNGLIRGKKASADVYVFTIEVICDNNDLVSQSGNIALLR